MTNPLAFVIEDDKNLSAALGEALKDANYTVEIFNDGETARKQLQNATPTLIILDLHIPYVSGKELLHLIRSMETLKQTKVIVASADAASADALQDQADLVLLKPVGFKQLRDLALRMRPADNT